jgi:hypothetical protein
LAALALGAGLSACAHAPKLQPLASTGPVKAPACAATDNQRPTAELVFARVAGDAPGPGVSEAAFSKFLTAQVAPRFPDGLTVIDAQDINAKPAGEALYGPAKVVVIVLPGRANDAAQLDAIRVAYTSQFKQKTVLEMSGPDCVSY